MRHCNTEGILHLAHSRINLMWAHQEKLSWTWLWAVSTHPQTVAGLVINWLVDPQLSVFLWVHPGLLLLWMVACKVWDTEAKPIVFVCNRAARRALNIVAELEGALVREEMYLFLTLRSFLAKRMCFSWVFFDSYHNSSTSLLVAWLLSRFCFLSECVRWLDDPFLSSSASLHWTSCCNMGRKICMSLNLLSAVEYLPVLEFVLYQTRLAKYFPLWHILCFCVLLQELEKREDIVVSLKLLSENIRTIRNSTQSECGTLLLQRLENNIRNYLLIITNLQLNVRTIKTSYYVEHLKTIFLIANI